MWWPSSSCTRFWTVRRQLRKFSHILQGPDSFTVAEAGQGVACRIVEVQEEDDDDMFMGGSKLPDKEVDGDLFTEVQDAQVQTEVTSQDGIICEEGEDVTEGDVSDW